MAKSPHVLFLTLRVFSATGGIEKVCRTLARVLANWQAAHPEKKSVALFSMYDHTNDADARYLGNIAFRGFSIRRLAFVFAAWRAGCAARVVVLSHVNLLLVAWLIRLFRPSVRIYLVAHGIEVWRTLPRWKVWALKRACTKVLAVSAFTRQDMIQRFQLEPNLVEVVPNGLDPLLAPPATEQQVGQLRSRFGLEGAHPILLTLTRIAHTEGYKGYDQVIRLIPRLLDAYPQLTYLMVGKYDAAEHDRIKNLAREVGVLDRLVFTGFLPDVDVPACFQLADLYVMPSKKEGFGIVFIEALHYGTPVVGGNKDGSTEALMHGQLGTLVDPDDDEAILQGIRKALLQGKADSRTVQSQFGFPAYERRMLDALGLDSHE